MNSLQQIGAEAKGILGVSFLVFVYSPVIFARRLLQLFIIEPVLLIFALLVALNLFYLFS